MRSTPKRDEWMRGRLAEAVEQFAGGSADKFGRMLGYANGGFIRQVLARKKDVREALIDRAEGASPALKGWFDSPDDAAREQPAGGYASLRSPFMAQAAGVVAITVLDVRASMGNGTVRQERESAVTEMVVDEQWLRRHASFSAPKNLALVTGKGDSMRPTFEDGDALLVDRAVTEVKVDAVYVLARDDELFIKRVQRRPDGSLVLLSDNKLYDPYHITDAERSRFAVLGRVVMAWNAKRM